jgi:hypothetical protein
VPPRITQASPAALPPPQPQTQNQLFVGYNLTAEGVSVLANEFYKIRGVVSRIEIDRMATDPTSAGLVSSLVQSCDQGSIDCGTGSLHPNSPTDRGIVFYVRDPNNPPESAKQVQSALLAVGLKIPFIERSEFAPERFAIFVGPQPRT